jgi:hypothetical protein
MNNKAVKKKAKKQAAKKKDPGMGELLGLLRTQPHLVRALIFDHAKVKRLLKSAAARRLIAGVDATTDPTPRFSIEVNDGTDDQHPVVSFKCLRRTI